MPKSFIVILFLTLLATIAQIGATVYKILISPELPILSEQEATPLPESLNFEILEILR